MGYYFGAYLDVVYEAVALRAEGEAGSDPGHTYSFAYRRKAPYCPGCQADFSEEDIRAGLSAGQIICRACGANTPARLADAELAAWDARLLAVVNDPGDTPLDAATTTSQPMIVSCLSCAAPLNVDGAERTVQCTHCSNTNVLPDAVWMKLHPIPTQQPFFLLVDAGRLFQIEAKAFFAPAEKNNEEDVDEWLTDPLSGSDSVVDHYWLDEKQRTRLEVEYRQEVVRLLDPESRSLLEQAFDSPRYRLIQKLLLELSELPSRFVAKGLANTDPSVRMVAVLRSELTQEQLQTLIEDPDDEVRLALAGRKSLDYADAQRLSRDPSSSVRAIIAARSDLLSTSAIERLASDKHEDVRFALAKSPHTSPESLKTLSRDTKMTVSEAARENPSFPRGFWSRLFGS